jgi:hypothetical protein
MLRDRKLIGLWLLEVLATIRTLQPSKGSELFTKANNKYAENSLALLRVVGNPEE